VLTIRFARPEHQNSFTPEQGKFIGRLFRLAEEDHDVRSIVLTGSGAGSAPVPTCGPLTSRPLGASLHR